MTKKINQLNALKIAKLTKTGLHGDGNGLYLQVYSPTSKCWVFRYQLRKRVRKMGLGPVTEMSLSQAREKALELRLLLKGGIDPITSRNEQRNAKLHQHKVVMDFDRCAASYIETYSTSWKNEKHRMQWESTLRTYASPVFGQLPVSQVDTSLVLQVLEPIWSTKTDTARRLRERIERVLTWAKLRGYRQGENPAQWQGHLEELLPKPTTVKRVAHHPALPFDQVSDFMQEIGQHEVLAAQALQLTILTACRTSEVICATWEEIDFAAGVWTIPAQRMKAQREHRVPLSKQALRLLQCLQSKTEISPWLFPGAKVGSHLTNMAMLKLLQRIGRNDITVHGFRSTFRDWVSESTNYPREVAEMALAHTIGSAVEAAYRRGDLFKKRSALMQEWADYCLPNA